MGLGLGLGLGFGLGLRLESGLNAQRVTAAARRRRCRLGRARDQLNQTTHRAFIRVGARRRIDLRRRACLVSAGWGSSCGAADSAGGDACVVKGSGIGNIGGG